jgi:hypothetical protein
LLIEQIKFGINYAHSKYRFQDDIIISSQANMAMKHKGTC